MASYFWNIFKWVVIPFLNFCYWYLLSSRLPFLHNFSFHHNQNINCTTIIPSTIYEVISCDKQHDTIKDIKNNIKDNINKCNTPELQETSDIEVVDSNIFDTHRTELLAAGDLRYLETYIIHSKKKNNSIEQTIHSDDSYNYKIPNSVHEPISKYPQWGGACDTIWQHYVPRGQCFAIVKVGIDEATELGMKNNKLVNKDQNPYPLLRFDDDIDDLGHELELVEQW
jgi:hypothetical protein